MFKNSAVLRMPGIWAMGGFVFAFSHCAAFASKALISGEEIQVGTPEGKGRLALGLSATVVGTVNDKCPLGAGLFISSSRHTEHPGLFFLPLVERTPEGAPVVGAAVQIKLPQELGKIPPAGTIFQTGDGLVHAWWLGKNSIFRTILGQSGREFNLSSAGDFKIEGLPHKAKWIGVRQGSDESIELLIGMEDETPTRPTDAPSWRDPAYRPFDGAGVYRAGIPFVFLYRTTLKNVNAAPDSPARLFTPTEQEAFLTYEHITPVDLGPGRAGDIVTGSWFGNLYHYANGAPGAKHLAPQRLIAGEDGNALFHPSVMPSPSAISNPQTGRLSDLVVGGEGAVYYYRFTGKFLGNGAPVYAGPFPILEKDARLYAGTLPVLNAVDWNGDGAIDLVAGNSEGRLIWFRNGGSNEIPAFADSEEIRAAGQPIQILPGYADIQGPIEARWGYLSPTVTDWNGDGLPDVVTSGATARHEVLLNVGSSKQPDLKKPGVIHCRGLDLHGTWRVQPGISKAGDRTAYVMLDDQDEFHLFWRIDDYNVEDGGKLRLEDGSPIRANFLSAGGTGRSKIVLADWDRDGRLDLLVGTPKHGSIPNPEKGLPQSGGLKGAAVVFLKNVGTNEEMLFARPVLLQFQGKPIYLGQHECSPALWDTGQPEGPDLLVGDQNGRIHYFQRKDLSWAPAKD